MYWLHCGYEDIMRVFMGVDGQDMVRCVNCNYGVQRPRIDTNDLSKEQQLLEETCYRLERSGQPFVAERVQRSLAGDGISLETVQAWIEERAQRLKKKYPMIDGPEMRKPAKEQE